MLKLSDFKPMVEVEENWTVRKVHVNRNGAVLLYQYKKSLYGEMAVLELPESTLLVVKEKPL